MANRQKRREREALLREQNSYVRKRFKEVKRSKDQFDFSFAERRALLDNHFIYWALPTQLRTRKTRRACQIALRILRDPRIHWGPAYEDGMDWFSDLFAHAKCRKLFLQRNAELKGMLVRGVPFVRRLDHWRAPKSHAYERWVESLCLEWFGAYRHQLPPFVRPNLRRRASRLTFERDPSGLVEAIFHLFRGQGLHTMGEAKAFDLPPSSFSALKYVPRDVWNLDVVLAFAKMVVQGVPPAYARHLIDWDGYMMAEMTRFKPVFGLWSLLAKYPNVQRSEVSLWAQLSYVLLQEMEERDVQVSSSHQTAILEYTLTGKAPTNELDIARWYRFCLQEVRRLGRQFSLIKRNQERLHRAYLTYCLEHDTTSGGGITWKKPRFSSWSQSVPGGSYQIVPLCSERELELEGMVMQHCVGGYANNCRKGYSSIWSLRWNPDNGWPKSLVTIELNAKGNVIQQYGKCNSKVPQLYKNKIRKWQHNYLQAGVVAT